MALSDTQREQLQTFKAQGLTKQQAFARVFQNEAPERPEGRFDDAVSDIGESIMGASRDIVKRRDNITESFQAGARGEQTPIETGAQAAGNAIGAVGDVAFRGLQALTKPFMKQSEEEALGQTVGRVVESTGIPQAIDQTSERTQRNITGSLGLFEGATAGAGGAATGPLRRAAGRMFGKQPMNTPEQVVDVAAKQLNRYANDESLSPRAREEAAKSALSFKERYVGLTPDVKSRLSDMGPQKLQEYLDAAHIRNIDDTAPTPYEVGAQNVNDALEKLDTELRNTGGRIGQARQKLASYNVPRPAVQEIENAFTGELNKLNLSVRNGEIRQTPGTISKLGSESDLRLLQKLYDEMQTFKQAPTLTNAIDLRMAFDGRIKYGKSAREVSNSVDPVSRATRKVIADKAGTIVGRENAAELQRYSDFMEAYSDLKSYTDRAAGGEYLLRLVLSGRGGEARKLIDTVREYTGQDLLNDATAMRVATDTLGNEQQKNLFRQEVTNAGYDAASVLGGGPTGAAQVIMRRVLDYAIDEEDVLMKAAQGAGAATGVYVLMQRNPELASAIGFAVASANPVTRREVTSRLSKIVDDATVGEMQDFSRVVREGGVVTNNKGEVQYKEIEGMSQREVKRAFEDGLRVIEMDAPTFVKLGEKSPGDIASFYDEVISQIENN